MSSNLSVSSGDDKPLGVKSNLRVQSNGHVASGNGKPPADDDEYSSMSEDDVPLVRRNAHHLINTTV